MLNIILWTATALSFIAYFFLNRKNVKAYYFFMVSNFLNLGYDIYIHNYAQMFMFTVFIIFNIDGIIKWRKSDKEKNKNMKKTLDKDA